jgi:putative flippase GtrA
MAGYMPNKGYVTDKQLEKDRRLEKWRELLKTTPQFNKMKLFLYCLRWQLSTPILFGVVYFFPKIGITNQLVSTIVANLAGSLIFFWVDKKIFKH